MLNCRVWCTFPYPPTVRAGRHIDVASDKHWGLCLPPIFRIEGRQQINKLPTLHPICKHCFFLFNPTTLPSLSNPCFSPNCHTVITSPRSLKQAAWRLDPLPFTRTPARLCHPSCCPHFHCTILLYKKYNPIDPKPDGKRWSVNIRVLNNGCSVLLRGDGRMGSVRDGGGVF